LANLDLTEEDNGREVSVRLGDEVRVSLKENPTTGYLWALASMLEGVLKLEESLFSAQSIGVGGGGTRRFLFRAIVPGRITLELRLLRPWESNVSPVERFDLIIVVR
jgi:inhibitor of cysteine peptidase